MAKSRKRKGHNKKIVSRNKKMKQAQTAFQKIMTEAMEKELENLKSQSGDTETITESENEMGLIQS